MSSDRDLAASERAMQMICATLHNGKHQDAQMWDIERVVDAWVLHPEKLTPDAMKEDLPGPPLMSVRQVDYTNKQGGKWLRICGAPSAAAPENSGTSTAANEAAEVV